MSAAAIVPVEQLEKRTAWWIELARQTEITDQPAYEIAAEHLQANKALQREADATFDPIIQKAYAAHKEACSQKKRITEPLVQAEALLKSKMGAWVQEQERIRREEERRLREEAERLAAEQREREIEEAEACGATVEEIAAIVEEPVWRTPVVVSSPPKVAGISPREVWKAEVSDLRAFIQYIAAHPEYSGLLTPDMPKITALVRTLRSAFLMPGIKAWPESSITARRTN